MTLTKPNLPSKTPSLASLRNDESPSPSVYGQNRSVPTTPPKTASLEGLPPFLLKWITLNLPAATGGPPHSSGPHAEDPYDIGSKNDWRREYSALASVSRKIRDVIWPLAVQTVWIGPKVDMARLAATLSPASRRHVKEILAYPFSNEFQGKHPKNLRRVSILRHFIASCPKLDTVHLYSAITPTRLWLKTPPMLCPTVRTLYLEDPGRGPLPGRSLGTCFPRLETLDIRETRPGLLSVPSGRAHQRIALALAVLFDDPLNKLKKLTLRLASTNPLYDPRYFDQRAQGWAAGRPIGALRNRLCGLKDLTIHISALYLDGNDAYDLRRVCEWVANLCAPLIHLQIRFESFDVHALMRKSILTGWKVDPHNLNCAEILAEGTTKGWTSVVQHVPTIKFLVQMVAMLSHKVPSLRKVAISHDLSGDPRDRVWSVAVFLRPCGEQQCKCPSLVDYRFDPVQAELLDADVRLNAALAWQEAHFAQYHPELMEEEVERITLPVGAMIGAGI